MGFDSPANSRGGFRGRGRGGDRGGGFSPRGRGGSPRGRDFGPPRGGGRGFGSPRGGRDFGPPRGGGRGFGSQRGGRDFGSQRGGRDFGSQRGGRDFGSQRGRDFSPRGRGGGGDFSPRGRGGGFGGRGGRGGRGGNFTPRGGASDRFNRDAASEKRKVYRDDDDEDEDVPQKKSKSLPSTPAGKKTFPPKGKAKPVEDPEEASDEDEEESDEEIAVKQPVKGKVTKPQVEEDSDEDEEDEDEEEFEDEDEEESEEEQEDESEVEPSKIGTIKITKNGKELIKSAPAQENDDEDDDDEEEDEDEEEEDEEEEEDDDDVSTPPLKSAIKGSVNSKTGKQVDMSTANTPTTADRKAPGTPHPKTAALKGKLDFDDDSEGDDEDEEEEDEEVEDEDDVDDEEVEDEDEDEAEDEEDEEDEDEEEKENQVVAAKAQKATAAAKKAEVVKTVQAKKAEQVKTGATQQEESRKRKTQDVAPSGKVMKISAEQIIEEEQRRRVERDSRSLFVKGFLKNTKTAVLEALHPDIESTESACDKAHEALSSKKLNGQTISVDFCGPKSTRPNVKGVTKMLNPINPLELYLNGLPKTATKEDLKNIFRSAVSIKSVSLMGARKTIGKAFIQFGTEEDAKAAFDKSRGLKIGGKLVDVYFARTKTEQITPPKKFTKPQANDDSGSEEDIPSSGEEIEEVPEKQKAKKVVKKVEKKGPVKKGGAKAAAKDSDDDEE